MRIAFLTDEFYPTFGANSLVVKTVCEELLREGHQVYVLPFHEKTNQPKEELWQGIRILRQVPADNMQAVKNTLKKGHIGSACKLAVNHLQKKFSSPHNLQTKKNLMAEVFLQHWLNSEKIDTVVSINCSVELSFPLLRLRKKGKLPCNWLFYMLDPFASHEYYLTHNSEKNLRKLQHEIMTCADGVLATKLIYDDTATWEEATILQKIRITEFPKIQQPEQQPCEDDVSLDPAYRHVICTGSKNETVRNSAYTLALCKQVADLPIRFHFMGYGWTQGREVVEEGNCLFYPPHSPQAAQNLQLKCDFLLNIGNGVTNQLPSKVLEYISTGKPVINFYKSETCPAKALLEKADALNISEQEPLETQEEPFRTFLTKPHTPASFEEIEQVYRAYTPNAVVKNFLY